MSDLNCIKKLVAENKRLFAAHSVEMVRADKLKQEVKRLREALHEIAGTSYSREVAADIAKQALEKDDE